MTRTLDSEHMDLFPYPYGDDASESEASAEGADGSMAEGADAAGLAGLGLGAVKPLEPELLSAFGPSEQPAHELTSGNDDADPHDGGETFLRYLARRRPQVDGLLAAATPAPAEESLQTSAAGDLISLLYGPLGAFWANGGKRVRPVLALLGCEAVGGDPARALSVAGCVEAFQSAALIHDDIADHGETRRGMPCLHRSIGEGAAVNAGDLALVEAFAILLRDTALSDAVLLQVMSEATYMMERTAEGQALDLGWANASRWDLAESDYLAMATLKTAHYSAAAPLAMGAICGDGTPEQVEALRSFGLCAGLAFQIADDLLNLEEGPAEKAKDWRSDITEGKRTLVAVHALSELSGAARDELLGLLAAGTTEPGELARAVELMEQAGSLAYARAKAEELVARAKAQLAEVELTPSARATLLSMADYFVRRRS